jgi:metal-sulfur cluster biosynthetic enzyme
MTLTSAFCPVADELVEDVRRAAGRVCGDKVDVELVFEPPWSVDSIPEHIRLEMGIL